MSRLFFIGLVAVVLTGLAAWRINQVSSSETLFESKFKPAQAAPMCPWREPEADLKTFFTNATRYQTETRILSGLRQELSQRLGRQPTGDENALRLYRIYQQDTPVGAVLTSRVKGQFGAIELVLAVNSEDNVCGLNLQRLREPKAIADALQNPRWLNSFTGKNAASSWKPGSDLPELPSDAQTSAQAVVEGVRTLLILFAAAEALPSPSSVAAHHD